MSGLLPAVPERGAAVSAAQVVAIEARVAEAIHDIEDIDQLDEWRARARALETYLRDKELQRPMLGAQRRVEARIGELLGPANRERDDAGRLTGHDPLGLRDDERVDFRVLAHALNGVHLTDDEWRKSRRALLSELRKRLGLRPETPPLPEGQFTCITADPPWQLDTGPDVFGGTGEAGHDALAYEQMSIEDIKALPVTKVTPEDCHLYLWTTNRYIEHAYDVVRAWGFRPGTMLVWCKARRGVGLGDAYRLTTEFVLFARRGKLPTLNTIPTTWFEWPRGKHSVKPTGFYEMVESVSPGPYLEMFARSERKGWAVWGDEVAEVTDGPL